MIPWLPLSCMLTSGAVLLLIWAALHDLAARTVPNALSAAILAIGICVRLLDHSVLPSLAIGSAMFIVLLALWLGGAIGGGDVKLWSACLVLVPPHWQTEFSCITRILLAGGILGLAYLILRRLVPRPQGAHSRRLLNRALRAEAWRISRKAPLPYAFAIAGGTIATLLPLPFLALR